MNDHQIEFIIGGSHGLSREVLDKSNHVNSASRLISIDYLKNNIIRTNL